MTERTARETVAQAIDDFDSIKAAIMFHKIDVPYATKTSEYGDLIAKIRVGSVAGAASVSTVCANSETIAGSVTQHRSGRVLNPIMGNASLPTLEEIFDIETE